MKLYTEGQIRDALDSEDFAYISNTIVARMQPIELPSNKEIVKECNKLPYEKHVDCGMYNDGQIDGFELGAKWMKEQIINQEKI